MANALESMDLKTDHHFAPGRFNRKIGTTLGILETLYIIYLSHGIKLSTRQTDTKTWLSYI